MVLLLPAGNDDRLLPVPGAVLGHHVGVGTNVLGIVHCFGFLTVRLGKVTCGDNWGSSLGWVCIQPSGSSSVKYS